MKEPINCIYIDLINFQINQEMSTITVNDNVTWDQVKSRVLAVGVALLFVYIVAPEIFR